VTQLRSLPFNGFNIGAIVSAVLLAFAVLLAIATIQDPLAALFIAFWNWKVVRIFPSFNPIEQGYVSWILTGYAGVSAVVTLLVGLKLAVWVSGHSSASR